MASQPGHGCADWSRPALTLAAFLPLPLPVSGCPFLLPLAWAWCAAAAFPDLEPRAMRVARALVGVASMATRAAMAAHAASAASLLPGIVNVARPGVGIKTTVLVAP